MAITVGSVEVDVVPNARGIYARLRSELVPAGNRVGDDLGRAIGRQVSTSIAQAIRDGVSVGGQQARVPASRSGEEAGGAFGRTFRARVQAAMRNLPRADVRLSDTGLDADLARLRARLETLSNKRIGVDVDAGAALAEIDRLEADLTRLGAQHPNVNVRVDTAQATAQLAALRAEIARMDGQDVNVRADVDTSAATSSLGGLTAAAALFGPAILPVLPIVAAGLGAIAAAGLAAGVGLASVAAVALPGITQIASALQAQKAAQDAAATATAKGAQANSQAASRALQLAGAQQGLATAERNGARQIAQAQQQVVQAKQAAADAIAQAAQRNEQAARQVQDAETALAQSQKASRQAQLDLVAARKAAAQELEDLANRYADAQLSQRDAALQLQEAQNNLNAVNAVGSKATELQRQEAQLAYDQALQRLKEQTTDTKRLKVEQAAASKAGVRGSATYQAAQDKVAQSQQEVADRTQALQDAQVNAAQVQVQASRQIAQAQQRVSEATANVAVAQQSAADAVSSAQRQIESASLSAAGSVDQAAVAQAKYRAELAKMTPATRDTFNAFLNLRDAFKAWSRSLQPAVMPLFTRALIGIKNALPGLTPFVLAAARAIGTLQDKVSTGFKSPWWLTFKKDLSGSIEPAIVGLGVSFGRIFKGMVGIVDAFLPHMAGISSTMQRITKRFSDWAGKLRGSPEFEGFLKYVKDNAPRVGDFLAKVMTALLSFSQAIAPTSAVIFAVVGPLLDALTWMSTNMPGLIQTLWGLYAVTKAVTLAKLAWAAAEGLYSTAMTIATAETWSFAAALAATGWTEIVALVVAIVAAIAALVAGVIYAYKHWGWFRAIVTGTWNAIKTAALFVWNSVLKPTFTAIWIGLQTIGKWATWLWKNAIGPAFRFIWEAAKILATILIVLVIGPMVLGFKVFGAIAIWLWKHAVGPTFRAIAAVVSWAWSKVIKPIFGLIGAAAGILYRNFIKPNFQAFKAILRAVGDVVSWLWKNVVRPVFGWIADRAGWLWTHALKPAFGFIKDGIGQVGKSFESARKFIKLQWDQVSGIAKKPVKFIIDTVYNHGIVPLWNKVAGITGAKKLSAMDLKGWATGGVLPGYTPGRDPHVFTSPTGGALALSGGEAVMRPEWTRGVGANFVASMNTIAKTKGVAGVQHAMGLKGYADGGILGSIKGLVSKPWDWAKDTASGLLKKGFNKLLDNFPGLDTQFGQLVQGIPTAMFKSLTSAGAKADTGGTGGKGVKAALTFARAQNGKPYQWAGVGNPSFDCSGLMGALESVILGENPRRRLWSTHSFNGATAPAGWKQGQKSPFMIGITAKGVGHTAGTLGGVNVESRGGDGVVVGSRARGYNNSLFESQYGFLPARTYDSGGYLPKGLNLAYNGTGRPEPVFTTGQANALSRVAAAPTAGGGTWEGDLYLDSGEWLGKVRGEVQQQMAGLTTVLRAGRKG